MVVVDLEANKEVVSVRTTPNRGTVPRYPRTHPQASVEAPGAPFSPLLKG